MIDLPNEGTANESGHGRKEAEALVRGWNLVYNRSVSYSISHPLVQEFIPQLHGLFQKFLQGGEPLNILLQEAMFYVGAVDIMYQPNNRRIADHLRRFGVESLTLPVGLTIQEFAAFIDACSAIHADAPAFMRYLGAHGVSGIEVNQVSLRAVREGDEVVSSPSSRGGERGTSVFPAFAPGGAEETGTFESIVYRAVLGKLTAQEMESNLALAQILVSPQAMGQMVSQTVSTAATGTQGPMLAQLAVNALAQFSSGAARQDYTVEELLAGIYSMRSEMLNAVKAQQSLDQSMRVDQADQATDQAFNDTISQIVFEEYAKTHGNAKRVAAVVARVVPGQRELRRLLPVLKDRMMREGTSLRDWYSLLTELNNLFLADRALEDLSQAAADFGVSAHEILEELRADPRSAARLLLTAAELRKQGGEGGGEQAVQSLIEHFEQAGDALAEHAEQRPADARQMAEMLQRMEGEIEKGLAEKELSPELRTAATRKLGLRMQRAMSELKARALAAQMRNQDLSVDEKVGVMGDLVRDEAELEGLMEAVGGLLGQDELARNIGQQVAAQVRARLQEEKQRAMGRELPKGVYVKAVAEFFLRFEISRAARYGVPFSAMLFSFQGMPEDPEAVRTHEAEMRGLLNVLSADLRRELREVDFVGYMAFNRFLLVLPMTTEENGDAVVRKLKEKLQRQVALPDGRRIWLRPRCGIASFDKARFGDFRSLTAELARKWQEDL